MRAKTVSQLVEFHGKCANGSLSQWKGSPQSCVPNVCQLCKTNLNSTALCIRSELCKLLIQGTLSQYGEPQATSAKKPKNGFVISTSGAMLLILQSAIGSFLRYI